MTDSKAPFTNGSLFRKKRHKEPPPTTQEVAPSSFISPPTPADAEFNVSSSNSDSASRPSTAFLADDAASATTNTTTTAATSATGTGSRRDSSISSLSDIKGHFRRHSASIRSKTSGQAPQLDNLALHSASTTSLRPTVNTAGLSSQQSTESVNQLPRAPASAVDLRAPRGFPSTQGIRKEDGLKPPPPIPGGGMNGSAAGNRSISLGTPMPTTSSQSNPRIIFQHIQDVASKRISTLDYLRKAHEGRVFWFNALRFTKEDLQKIPYFDPRRLSRRATNYLLLGVSIPAILDPHKDVASEYLRQFHTLLSEFESYQSVHTPDGTAPSSLSRARIPQMFKRAAHASSSNKGRRGSSTEALSPQNSAEAGDARIAGSLHSTSSTPSYTSFPASDQELLPGEEYSLLLTPLLPFEPDYFETFATLCDVLIDCYTRVMGLVNSPDAATATVGDLFAKSDAKVRKILIAGLVRDFEDASKQGIKSELAGVGKIALGGLM